MKNSCLTWIFEPDKKLQTTDRYSIGKLNLKFYLTSRFKKWTKIYLEEHHKVYQQYACQNL